MTLFRLPSMPEDINSDSMREFLLELKNIGMLYHIDDDPRQVFNHATGERTFSNAEAYALIGLFNACTIGGKLPWDDIWDCMPPIEG